MALTPCLALAGGVEEVAVADMGRAVFDTIILRMAIDGVSKDFVLYRVWAVQRNSKSEYRNSKQIRSFKFPNASNYRAANLNLF